MKTEYRVIIETIENNSVNCLVYSSALDNDKHYYNVELDNSTQELNIYSELSLDCSIIDNDTFKSAFRQVLNAFIIDNDIDEETNAIIEESFTFSTEELENTQLVFTFLKNSNTLACAFEDVNTQKYLDDDIVLDMFDVDNDLHIDAEDLQAQRVYAHKMLDAYIDAIIKRQA